MQLPFNLSVNQDKKTLIVGAIIIMLLVGNIAFGMGYLLQRQENKAIENQVKAQQTNSQVIGFLDLFIQKVLKTDKEVSFEDRLKLENAIRDINDPELLARWEQFTAGTNEYEIQKGVKDLLEALVRKMYH